MRRFRRRKGGDLLEDDEELSFDDIDDDEDYGRRPRRRRYVPPQPIRNPFEDDDSSEAHEKDQERFDEIEPQIRAGEYKPVPSDPWTAHVLYNLLKSSGRI